jgi:predicted nucleotidyltransferase
VSEPVRAADQVMRALQERAKELNCLYRIEETLRADQLPLEDLLQAVVNTLPAGWQYPTHCAARIRVREVEVTSPGFAEAPWTQHEKIELHGQAVGLLSVCYTQRFPDADEGPFLRDERRLIGTVAGRIGQTVLHRELAEVFATARPDAVPRADWRILVDILRRTDQRLYYRTARKMLNRLSRSGVEDAKSLLAHLSGTRDEDEAEPPDENRPLRRQQEQDLDVVAAETFRIAAEHLSEGELLSSIQMWLQEDRVNFLVMALESSDTSLADIANAVERFQHTGLNARDLSTAMQMGLKVSLVRRLLTENLEFIDACRRVVELEDFFDLLAHVIQLPRSHGRLGGKSSGLFLAAQALRHLPAAQGPLREIKVPKTWYLPSDGILQFIAHNALDEVFNWKYRDLDQVRQEYPNLLQVFKNSRFPAEFVQGLASALDDFGDRPLIVRSSSLLEDRAGSAFSGKYKSLFLANQGSKSQRLSVLLDAIAEVYASVFGPDPIQYRAERGLLDHHEEMGIMIQEVVGTRVGRYWMPAWAGVAFSHNELRWSPRIRREDGLLRLVPGLGTRAVDRLADDYPVLAAPGQPDLRVNVSPEDIVRYSPRKVDVIDLELADFATVERDALLREIGAEYPDIARLVSVFEHDRIRRPGLFDIDFERDQLVFTFDGLLSDPAFVGRMRALLDVLTSALGAPVDLEFACDGRDFYLLQCRAQSRSPDTAPAPIPRDLPAAAVLFSANRYVTNGSVPDVTHIVYVDPDAYGGVADLNVLRDIGRVVGKLNKVLPKRQFILMGPGRWGSRGDIKLGVAVTYSDINNTALLIEIARKRGSYVPDLSFGTHFFQDLVESHIRYLPLYPDDEGVAFNAPFFRHAENMLPRLLPEFAELADVVKVIDVPKAADGRVLRVLMNADLDEAVGVLGAPGPLELRSRFEPLAAAARPNDEHSRWRQGMAQRIAAELDPAALGVRAAYLIGSVKNGTAGPGSDIDLLVHFVGSPEQRRELMWWLEGWSQALAEINFLRTGYRTEGLLDVHFVSDQDFAEHTSFAAKIGAVTDAARPLPLKKKA